MNRLIIIGNGFDLAHGLKTSYMDFLEWVKSKIIENPDEYFEHISIPKTDPPYLVTKTPKVSDFLERYNIDPKNLFEFISNHKEYKLVYKNNFLENLINKQTLKNWVDIEEEYFSSLNTYLESDKKEAIENLNKEFSAVQKALEDYLKQIINNPPNFLEQIEQNIYLKPSQKIMEIIEDIKYVNKYVNILFLNFNYTNTESLYKKNLLNDNEIDIIHIHGELDSPSNPIIFGYGDDIDKKYKHIEDKNENEFLEKIKSIKYLETDNYKKLLTFIDSDKYEIFIMGHSCGISDRTLLNTLFEHENCLSIKIFYHKRKDGSDDFSDVARNISRNFTNKQIMRKRVVDKTNSVPLSNLERD